MHTEVTILLLRVEIRGGKKMKNVYAYIRVSTKEQNEDRQILAIKKLKIEGIKIYIDKQSGKDFKRLMCTHNPGHVKI